MAKSDEEGVTKTHIEEELSRGADISIVDLVDSLVEYGYRARASDIHIDPEENRVRVRFRIDGVLHDVFIFPKNIQSEVVTRIKVLAGLRTDEHQAAQDGRFRSAIKDVGYVDVRVAIAPTYHGENVALRILATQSGEYTLETLGCSTKDLKRIQKAIEKPYGMILATGPTGSGKTTTLYAILKKLNKPDVSIITIEDPIEYAIPGINQIQVNPRTNLTFAKGLRSILRQDPNIIMVGEIRDEETAEIAVNAALTGHLLLSTLHTNDAATAFPRLIDMKIEPFLIASTVNVAIGQRLVRKICEHCKVKKTLSDSEWKSLLESLPEDLLDGNRVFYYGKGCSQCGDTGYFDRIGIYEVLEVNKEIRDAILRRASAEEIKAIAVKNGMTTMVEDGVAKAFEGITTIEEVLRVIHE